MRWVVVIQTPREATTTTTTRLTPLGAHGIQEAKEFADSMNMEFIETSAKQSSNVDRAFLTIATQIKNRMANQPMQAGAASGSTPVTRLEGNKVEPGGCC